MSPEDQRKRLNARRAACSKKGNLRAVEGRRERQADQAVSLETLKRVREQFHLRNLRQFGEWLNDEIERAERKPPKLRVVGTK